MTSPSISVFGEEAPHTQRLSVDNRLLGKVEPDTTPSYSVSDLRAYLDRQACVKMNETKILYEARKQKTVTPENLYSKQRYAPIVRVRNWCWLFLYHHPVAGRISTPTLGKIYNRDYTTVLHGIRRAKHVLIDRPNSVESRCIKELGADLSKHFGPFDVMQVARV